MQVWLNFLPGSAFHQTFPQLYDWSLIEDGQFVPKGAPMSPRECKDRFENLIAKFDPNIINSNEFDKQIFMSVVELLKIGRAAFPGMIIDRTEVDMAVQWALKAGLMETIKSFIMGKGKEKYQEEIWRELKDFDVLTVIKIKGFAPRPTVAVYTTGKSGSMIQIHDLISRIGEKYKKTPNAVAKIKLRARIMVRHHHKYYQFICVKIITGQISNFTLGNRQIHNVLSVVILQVILHGHHPIAWRPNESATAISSIRNQKKSF